MYEYIEILNCLEESWHIAKHRVDTIKAALKSKKGALYEINHKPTLDNHGIDFLSILNRVENAMVALWREKVGDAKYEKVEDKYLELEEYKGTLCEYIIENHKNWRRNSN